MNSESGSARTKRKSVGGCNIIRKKKRSDDERPKILEVINIKYPTTGSLWVDQFPVVSIPLRNEVQLRYVESEEIEMKDVRIGGFMNIAYIVYKRKLRDSIRKNNVDMEWDEDEDYFGLRRLFSCEEDFKNMEMEMEMEEQEQEQEQEQEDMMDLVEDNGNDVMEVIQEAGQEFIYWKDLEEEEKRRWLMEMNEEEWIHRVTVVARAGYDWQEWMRQVHVLQIEYARDVLERIERM